MRKNQAPVHPAKAQNLRRPAPPVAATQLSIEPGVALIDHLGTAGPTTGREFAEP
jgi:hypothetical protein